MIVLRSKLVVPGSNDALMIAAVAVSLFIFAYSTRFGALPILLYFAVWFPLVAMAPAVWLRNALHGWPVIALVLLTMVSVLWSAAPATTLRASVQLGSHAICAIAAASFVSWRAMVRGLAIGAGLVLLYSVAVGRSSYDIMDGTYTFVGAFGSKNQLGFYASLCTVASLLIFAEPVERGQSRLLRAAWLALALAGLAVLQASSSATALLAMVASLAVLIAAFMMTRLAPFPRLAMSLLTVMLVSMSAFVAVQAGAIEALLGAVGKDATLTGRTYLWSQGMEAAAQAPLLGVGYQAYWVQGFSEAERLWAEFYIETRSGFHFHHTYIESLVELGAVGTSLIILLFLAVLVRLLRVLLKRRPNPSAFPVLALLVLLIVRSFSEVDVLTPYVIGSFLLFWAVTYTRMPVFAGSTSPVMARLPTSAAVGAA